MDAENKSNTQELNEQELEEASGAGTQGEWKCPRCGGTEYETVGKVVLRGWRFVKQCKTCHRET